MQQKPFGGTQNDKKHREDRQAQLAAEFGWLAERINEGRISWTFVDQVLKENDVEVRLR